jgi:hypothetical protein
MTLLAIAMNGCAAKTRTLVIDSRTDWVRLDEPVKAKVSTYQGQGVWTPVGPTILPAGMVVGPGKVDGE